MPAASQSMSLEDAVAALSEFTPVQGTETLPLIQCEGRVLAENIVATEPVPAHPNSAMDGYAFRHSDLRAARRLPLQGRVAAGHPLGEELLPGHAVRIFTGGMVPDGADTVAMQEICEADDDFVDLPADIALGTSVRPIGDDIAAGAEVLTAGTRLRPQEIGSAASVGRSTLEVHRQLKVAIATTGDELRSPGEDLPPGFIRDSNRHTLGAALRALGAEVTDYGVLRDDVDLIRTTLASAAKEHDLVFSTGGVSVGDEDHVKPAVEAIGSLAFWRLPIKPGRPVAVGNIEGTPFVGLPGNPVSVMIAFWLVGRPLLMHLAGATPREVTRYPATADFDYARQPGRREFLRGRLQVDESGHARVTVYQASGSGMLSSLVWADGLVEIHEDVGDVHPGDAVRFISFTELLS